jgi:hypothetical protein
MALFYVFYEIKANFHYQKNSKIFAKCLNAYRY